MTVKILSLLLMTFVTLVFSGCAKEVLVPKPYEVYVPVVKKCDMPIVHCNFDRPTYTEVILAQRTCIEDLRHAIQVCNKTQDNFVAYENKATK